MRERIEALTDENASLKEKVSVIKQPSIPADELESGEFEVEIDGSVRVQDIQTYASDNYKMERVGNVERYIPGDRANIDKRVKRRANATFACKILPMG